MSTATAKRSSSSSSVLLSDVHVCEFEFTSVSPLLMDKPPMKLAKTTTKATQIEEMIAQQVYRDENSGILYIPTYWFRTSVIAGAKGKKLPGMGKLGADTVIKSSLFPAEEKSLLYHPETHEPIVTWNSINSRNCRKNDGKLTELHQPQIDTWACKARFQLDFVNLNPDTMVQLFELAGRIAGIGAWRPRGSNGGSGIYGRFAVRFVGEVE